MGRLELCFSRVLEPTLIYGDISTAVAIRVVICVAHSLNEHGRQAGLIVSRALDLEGYR